MMKKACKKVFRIMIFKDVDILRIEYDELGSKIINFI